MVPPQIARVHLWERLPLPPIQRIDGERPDVVADVVIETEHAVWTLIAESARNDLTDSRSMAAVVDAGAWFGAALARALGVAEGERAPLADVREAVLGLRRGKGMVLDAADHDTWSAGSFFTNPFLTPEQAAALPDDAPRWEQPDGRVKSSAAWLIERAGFRKGHGLDVRGGRASLSTKHTLALTNRGGARSAGEELSCGGRELVGRRARATRSATRGLTGRWPLRSARRRPLSCPHHHRG